MTLVPGIYQFPEWGADTPRDWWSAPNTKSRLVPYDKEGHYGVLLDVVDTNPGHVGVAYDVLRCEPCRRIHVMPLPSHAWLADFYQQRFYEVNHADYVERYERDRTWWEMWHSTKLMIADCAANSAEERITRQKKVLDIGAGPGLFLDEARRDGYETCALEPSEQMCVRLHERGHEVICGTLTGVPAIWADTKFDLIHMHEVLEHVADPDEVLTTCHEMLADDGHLVIVVPNDYNPLQMMVCDLGLVQRKWWLAPPEHLSYFTPKTLQLTLNHNGFKLYDMIGTYPLEQFILMGRNYIGHDVLGREIHTERMIMEARHYMFGMWPWYLNHLRDMLHLGRSGREIIAFASKRQPAEVT